MSKDIHAYTEIKAVRTLAVELDDDGSDAFQEAVLRAARAQKAAEQSELEKIYSKKAAGENSDFE